MSSSGTYRVNLRPLRLISTLRVVIAALLVAFGVLLFLSFGKKEESAIRIQITPPVNPGGQVVDLSEKFAIVGTKGGREAFHLEADHVTGYEGERKLLKGVHLEVFNEEGEHLAISGDSGQFEMSSKRAELRGQARVEGKNGFVLTADSLSFDGDRDLIFTPDPVAFEAHGVSGTGKGLNYLTNEKSVKIPAEVNVKVVSEDPQAPPAIVTSGEMVLSLLDNDVVFNQAVHLVRGGESLSADYLHLQLDETHHRLLSTKAFGKVQAELLSGKDATPASLWADSVTTVFREDGSGLERVEAEGNCRMTSSGMEGTSQSMLAQLPEDTVAMRGEPVVVDVRSRIAAQEIDLHPGTRGLEARGDVKTSFQGQEGQPSSASASYFAPGEPVFFQSRRLSIEDAGGMARFSGSVRGWQGEDSIQAEEIILHFAEKSMTAYQNVLCRFVSGESSDAGSAKDASPLTLVLASALEYAEGEGIVHFRDSVKLSKSDSTVFSDRMHITLTDPALGKRRVRQAVGEGNARFTHLNYSGTSDRLIYFPEQELAQLQQDAGLAEVVDHTSGRVLKGKTLDFDLAANRVLTESSDGGRTWITLDPKQKDTPGLEPKIGH